MKRADIISRLLEEGFTSKTLANFSDKQLEMLSKRMLTEETTTIATPEDFDKPDFKNKVRSGANSGGIDLKVVKKGSPVTTIAEKSLPGLKAKKMEVKESGAMPGLTVKGKTNVNPTEKKHVTKEKEVNEKEECNCDKKTEMDEKKKPSSGLSKEKRSEVVKKAKKGEDIGEKGKNFKKVEKAAEKSGAKDPKAVAASAMWKNLRRENKTVNEWVEDVIKKNYHPFTTKAEIMEMIGEKIRVSKMPKSFTARAIKNAGEVEPLTKPKVPTTKPDTKPRPKTPYEPGPGINPHPKAVMNLSEAKNPKKKEVAKKQTQQKNNNKNNNTKKK